MQVEFKKGSPFVVLNNDDYYRKVKDKIYKSFLLKL